MHDTPAFVASYSESEQPQIAFAWNGKHAADFVDLNQEFRWTVVEHCLAKRSSASLLLLSDLFMADADWSREAWGAPHHFAQLGSLLLERGGANALDTFSKGFNRSFDTFGACHEMALSPKLLEELSDAVAVRLSGTLDESSQTHLAACRELFAKLTQGTATDGWATVAPDTPVSNVRIVWPRWYHKAWLKLTGRRGAT